MQINEDYFDISTPLYQWKKHPHKGCSDGKSDSLSVARWPDHWRYTCHRCGTGGRRNIDGISPSQAAKLLRSRDEAQVQRVKEIKLPDDYTSELPVSALAWLYSFGITDEEIDVNNIGWSQSYERVILPVYADGVLVYWQGRLLTKPTPTRPKYINIYSSERKDVYFRVTCSQRTSKVVVIVEDILSAIKVGRVFNSISLLGAYIQDSLALSLRGYTIYIWLDSNKYIESLKYLRRFRSFGIDCRIIHTDKDPKCYDTLEIEGRLNSDQ